MFPTVAAQPTGGAGDPRCSAFVDRMEAGLAAQLAAAPERMKVPLAKLVLAKASG